MQNQLDLLDRRVNAMVDYELGESNQPPVASQRTRNVVLLGKLPTRAKDDENVSPEAAQMLKTLLDFRSSAGKLKEALDQQGLTALAIVPATTWDQLCSAAGLFRFQPKGDVVLFDHHAIFRQINILVKSAESALNRRTALKKLYIFMGSLAAAVILTVLHSNFWLIVFSSAVGAFILKKLVDYLCKDDDDFPPVLKPS